MKTLDRYIKEGFFGNVGAQVSEKEIISTFDNIFRKNRLSQYNKTAHWEDKYKSYVISIANTKGTSEEVIAESDIKALMKIEYPLKIRFENMAALAFTRDNTDISRDQIKFLDNTLLFDKGLHHLYIRDADIQSADELSNIISNMNNFDIPIPVQLYVIFDGCSKLTTLGKVFNTITVPMRINVRMCKNFDGAGSMLSKYVNVLCIKSCPNVDMSWLTSGGVKNLSLVSNNKDIDIFKDLSLPILKKLETLYIDITTIKTPQPKGLKLTNTSLVVDLFDYKVQNIEKVIKNKMIDLTSQNDLDLIISNASSKEVIWLRDNIDKWITDTYGSDCKCKSHVY